MAHYDPASNNDSSQGNSSRFTGSEEDFRRIFALVVANFQKPLVEYLQQRGISAVDSEETVQDFFASQLVKRTAIHRMHQWLEGESPTSRCLAFLRACVLHHYLDIVRKRNKHDDVVQQAAEMFGANSDAVLASPIHPLSFEWAISIFKLALDDMKLSLIGDPNAAQQSKNQLAASDSIQTRPNQDQVIIWRIFVERFIALSPRKNAQRKSTAIEIGRRLGLSRDQVVRRIQQIRDILICHIRQALAESCLDGDIDELFSELRVTLILGGVHLPNLLVDGAGDASESNSEQQIFSICGVGEAESDAIIDLLIEPEANGDYKETKVLWNLLMRRGWPHAQEKLGKTAARTVPRTIQSLLFSHEPELSDLEIIKNVARDNGQQEHDVLRQVYHVLYTLAIARAKNIWDVSMTSLPSEQRNYSLRFAAQYPWIPDDVSRELEVAIRKFTEESSSNSSEPLGLET